MSGLNSTPSHTALKLLRVKNQQSRDENNARSQRQSHDQREGLRGLSDRIPHAWGAGMVTRRVSLEPSSRPGEENCATGAATRRMEGFHCKMVPNAQDEVKVER